MRLEKSFGTWAREYRPIYGPYEAGLGRFVDLKKGDFIGRAAAAEEKEQGGERRLIALRGGCADADAIGDEPIWHDGQVVGWVTSGGYGHSVGKSHRAGLRRRARAGGVGLRGRDHRRAAAGRAAGGACL